MKDSATSDDSATAEKSVWLQFLETTSVKGVSRIVRSPSPCLRAMWLVGVLFGTCMAIYYISSLIILYFKHKTVFSINEPSLKAPFPDLTICNLSPASAITNGELLLQEHIDRITNLITEIKNGPGDLSEEDRYLVATLESLESPTGFIQSLDVEFLDAVDNQTQLMLIECIWRGSNAKPTDSCHRSYRQVIFDASRGRCLTFHTEGSVNIFRALLYLNDFVEVYMPDFDVNAPQSMGGGALLMLHEPGTLPDLRAGINMPPGYQSSIVLSTTQRKMLSDPFSDCLEDTRLQFPEGIDGADGVVFSFIGCQDLCMQNYVMAHCRCISPWLGSTPQLRKRYPFCGRLLPDVKETHEKYQCSMRMMEAQIDCRCPRACVEYQYNYRTFQARWPHPSLQVGFYTKYIKDKPYADKFAAYELIEKEIKNNKSAAYEMMWGDKLMRRNFLYLEVRYVDERQDVEYEQRPALAKETLLGNLGGTLNLWVGVSFITAVEFFELCYNLARRRIMQHRRPTQSPRCVKDKATSVTLH